MSTNPWARYGALATAAAAFIGAALEQSTDERSAVLVTVGLILTGVWITLEVHYLLPRHTQHQEETDDE